MWFSHQVSKVFQFIQWQFWPSCVGGTHPGEGRALIHINYYTTLTISQWVNIVQLNYYLISYVYICTHKWIKL